LAGEGTYQDVEVLDIYCNVIEYFGARADLDESLIIKFSR